MEDTFLLNHPGVKKKILAGGSGPLPHLPIGTKLVFHFQTLLDDFERTVIDDSRLAGRPAEIFAGKMFKMEVWETLLGSMRIGEVAEFWCDAVHTGLYPIVSKGMRLVAQGKDPLEGQRHTCGMGNMFNYHSTGFPELDELMRTPQPLIFIMELLQVGDPMSYERESWMMEKDEKLQMVPILHMQGNALVKQRKYREAASKYKEAVLLLKTVQSREMPGDIDYINLGRMIIPLELNYCQCMLELEEYYDVIEHTTELLEKHKVCVKGYYKRAKAHAAVWNEKEARRDFNMVSHLDATLISLIHRELKNLSETNEEALGGNEGMVNEEETSSSEINPNDANNKEGKDWQQMLRLIMMLQKEGNFLMKENQLKEASLKFKEAIEYVDILQNTQVVDQQGEDWESLEKVCLPLSLNLSQCLLELKENQQVVELNNKLLKKHRGNFKAVYQRARAHCALCNDVKARRDLDMVEKLDPSFKPYVRKELQKLGESVRLMQCRQNKTYWDTTQEKWGPEGSKTKSAARKKKVRFAQKITDEKTKAEKKTEVSKIEDEESSEKPAPAETEGVDDAGTGKDPDVKAELSNKGLESGRASEDNENTESVAVPGEGQGAPDNRATDKDSDPEPTGTGKDNVVSNRSVQDKVTEKVKCPSSGELGQREAAQGNKDPCDKTGNDGTQSE
ncbi:Aryl-hydrocarbon-interacting protein-like 1 [Dissostichus eleginoides]|uniref:Aryl-hydrocarbon-interacting protein-like 1 n=1 Tax=Dissostichus eleginoides TaxID=100907 RepID=A0AAD9CMD6_DISEL|nr:Aryl-hydrocarbon-interacting protein-like 1 [Dissostichus eleginoides]